MTTWVFTVHVGVALARPVVPDEDMIRVRVAARTEAEACCVAAQMAACHPRVVMPTSTTVIDAEV